MARKEIPWFYHSDLNHTFLAPEEARHALSALRLKEGEQVVLTNGAGGKAQARIAAIRKEGIEMSISIPTYQDRGTKKKTLVIGRLHHPDRMEWLVEKVQELSLSRMMVVDMDHSAKGKLNLERLQRLAVSALKQSQQIWLCEIEQVDSLQSALASCSGKGIFGYIDESGALPDSITMHYEADFAVIGPEADLSDSEIALMRKEGLVPVHLGSTRLRAETAGLAATVFLQIS